MKKSRLRSAGIDVDTINVEPKDDKYQTRDPFPDSDRGYERVQNQPQQNGYEGGSMSEDDEISDHEEKYEAQAIDDSSQRPVTSEFQYSRQNFAPIQQPSDQYQGDSRYSESEDVI